MTGTTFAGLRNCGQLKAKHTFARKTNKIHLSIGWQERGEGLLGGQAATGPGSRGYCGLKVWIEEVEEWHDDSQRIDGKPVFAKFSSLFCMDVGQVGKSWVQGK